VRDPGVAGRAVRYRLLAADETLLADGAGRAAVTGGVLVVTPDAGAPLTVRPADVLGVRDAGPGALHLTLTDGLLQLEHLGRLHGQLLADLADARGAAAGALLGTGRPEVFPGALGDVAAEFRLSDDVLLVVPREGPPDPVPYALIGEVAGGDGGRVLVRTLDERTLELSRLARRTGEFTDLLRARVAAARTRSTYLVGALLPGLGPVAARAVAEALPDGLAATRARLDAADPAGPSVFEALLAACTHPDRIAQADHLVALGEAAVGLHQRASVERPGTATAGTTGPVTPGVRDHGGTPAAPGGLAGVLQGAVTEALGDPGGVVGVGGLLAYRLLGPASGGGSGAARTPVGRAEPHHGRARAAWTDLAALDVGPDHPAVAFLLVTTPHGDVVHEVLSETGTDTCVYRGVPPVTVNGALAAIGFRPDALTGGRSLPVLLLRDALVARVPHDGDWRRRLDEVLAG